MTRKIQLPQIQNVGPNKKASLRLPLGHTYNKFALFCEGNVNASLLSNFVLKMNKSERSRWNTRAHLQARNSYNGGALDANVVEFDFLERNAKDEAAMTIGAWAATAEAGVQDLTLEFDIGNYVDSAASIITATAEVDVPSANRLLVRHRYQQKVFTAAVEDQLTVPYGRTGELLKRMYIFGTLADIDYVRIRREGADEFEQMTVAKNEFFQKTYGKTPQAGLFVVDFTEHNLMGHMLNTSSIMGPNGKPIVIENLDIKMKTKGASTFDIYTESVTTNDRP